MVLRWLCAVLYFAALCRAEFLFGSFPDGFQWGLTNPELIGEDGKYICMSKACLFYIM